MDVKVLGFVGAALALHLAVPLAARLVPQREPPLLARSSHRGTDTFEIEVDAPMPSPPPPVPALARNDIEPPHVDPLREPRAIEPNPRAAPNTEAPLPEPSSTVAPSAAPAAPPAPTDEYGGAPAPPSGPDVPGLNGRPVWQTPGVLPGVASAAPAPTTTPSERRIDRDTATKVLGTLLNEKNHATGVDLPGAGTIAERVKEAVWGSDVPAVSRCSFQVRLSPAGKVIGVSAMGWTAGSPEIWQRVAALATAKFAGFALAMNGAFATGAIVTVRVVSALTLPAGGNGPSRSGASLSFDLTDIGAKPHRTISASFSVTPAS
jgi:hypothetical protein